MGERRHVCWTPLVRGRIFFWKITDEDTDEGTEEGTDEDTDEDVPQLQLGNVDQDQK